MENQAIVDGLRSKQHELTLNHEMQRREIDNCRSDNSKWTVIKMKQESLNKEHMKSIAELALKVSLMERRNNKTEFMIKKMSQEREQLILDTVG
jgi:hypothetical protein